MLGKGVCITDFSHQVMMVLFYPHVGIMVESGYWRVLLIRRLECGPVGTKIHSSPLVHNDTTSPPQRTWKWAKFNSMTLWYDIVQLWEFEYVLGYTIMICSNDGLNNIICRLITHSGRILQMYIFTTWINLYFWQVAMISTSTSTTLIHQNQTTLKGITINFSPRLFW